MIQTLKRLLHNAIVLLAIAVASHFSCIAADLPPDITAELAEARAAWRKADELTLKMGDKFADPKDLDGIIDARDAAHERAIAMFEAALKKDPTHPQALAEFGRYWVSRRDFFIARRYFENAWSSSFAAGANPSKEKPAAKNPPADGCGSRAEKTFTEADKADVLRALGGIAERSGEADSALAYYRAAMNRYPADPRNRVSLGVCLCATGNPADASTLLDAWEKPPESGAAAAPDYPAGPPEILALGLYTLALAKEELGWNSDALALYRRAEDACKKGLANTSETAENAHMAIARLEDRLDEFAANDAEINTRIEALDKKNVERKKLNIPPIPPPESDAILYADALNYCSLALESKKLALRDPDFLAAMSKLRFNEIKAKEVENAPSYGLFQSAENSLQASIKRFARFARSYYELALCELQMHRYSLARNLLDAAALYNPNDVATLSLRGAVLLELGQWQEASEVFRKIIQLDGDNGAAHFSLGRALTALKSNEAVCSEALDAFSRAMRLGVRDERLEISRSLTTKDGQLYAGRIVEDGDDWIVMEEGAKPLRIAKAEVKDVHEGDGLRAQAAGMLVRYQRGEQPVQVKRYTGNHKHLEDEVTAPLSPYGAIFGQ